MLIKRGSNFGSENPLFLLLLSDGRNLRSDPVDNFR